MANTELSHNSESLDPVSPPDPSVIAFNMEEHLSTARDLAKAIMFMNTTDLCDASCSLSRLSMLILDELEKAEEMREVIATSLHGQRDTKSGGVSS